LIRARQIDPRSDSALRLNRHLFNYPILRGRPGSVAC
jgi:hypothetical protein